MKGRILKYRLEIAGAAIGAIAGFLYWKYAGCTSGTCAITSSPLNSSVYGAVMGAPVSGLFRKTKHNNKKTQE